MGLGFEPGVKIDGGNLWLTDQGRGPVEVAREGRFVEHELASGRIKRQWQGSSKSTFSISWDWLPSNDASTVDGYAARDRIRALLKDSQATHTLTFDDEDGDEETYTVWVEEYIETLKRRTPEDFFWEVTVSFKEQ